MYVAIHLLVQPFNTFISGHTGDIVVTERSPTHQVQIFNQYGQFVRKFGANVLQHPRGVTVDHLGRIVIVECKVRTAQTLQKLSGGYNLIYISVREQ